MATLKENAGNLRYPRTKILLNSVTSGNIAGQIKVIPSDSNALGTGRLLSLPQEGITISENERYEIELKQGRAGTVRKSILTIGNPDACTECSFEYGFGVRRKQYGKVEYQRPNQWITAGYYDVMSNPNAIDGTTGLFTANTLAIMNENLVDMVNEHVGYHPDAGPVVKACRVYKITRDTSGSYDVDITIGDTTTTVAHATVATFVGLLKAKTTTVSWAWSTGSGTTAIIYVAVYDTVTIVSGASNTTVARENTMIGLEGLYVNPSFDVVNPKGFELTTNIVVNGLQPYMDGAQIFDKFFARKHQGNLSQWTRLDQPVDTIYNKRVIFVETDTAAIHGASHSNGYMHIYEIYYPGDSTTETLMAALFEAAGGVTPNKFPLSHL